MSVSIITQWITCRMSALKFLLNNSNICIMLVLHLLIVPVLDTMNDFVLKSGYFGYDAVRLGSCLSVVFQLVSSHSDGRRGDLYTADGGQVVKV